MTNNDFKKYIKKYGANNALLTAETVEHIQIALNAGADVNAKHQISGRTALICEAGYGHTEIVKLLIEKGADVNAKDSNGKTVLDFAKTDEMKELLRKHGALSIIQINEQIKKQKSAPAFQFKLSKTKKR